MIGNLSGRGGPARNRGQQNTGWALRGATTRLVNASSPVLAADPSNQVIWLSWQ